VDIVSVILEFLKYFLESHLHNNIIGVILLCKLSAITIQMFIRNPWVTVNHITAAAWLSSTAVGIPNNNLKPYNIMLHKVSY